MKGRNYYNLTYEEHGARRVREEKVCRQREEARRLAEEKSRKGWEKEEREQRGTGRARASHKGSRRERLVEDSTTKRLRRSLQYIPDGKANQVEGGIHLTRRMAKTRLERESLRVDMTTSVVG